jgi:hypothetical protein
LAEIDLEREVISILLVSGCRKEEEEQMRGKIHPVSASDCPRLEYFEVSY